jgi:glutamate-ammonia-ligase adenylyltransferase
VRRRPGLVHFLASHKGFIGDIFPALMRCDVVADLLGSQPSLVEALSTWDRLDVPHEQWEASAQAIPAKASSYEERLEWLRRLKNERFFLLALADLAGLLSHEALERALSDLADFVVRRTLEAVTDAVGLDPNLPLAVIALGSLGSREMDYLSDVDLMFVYEPEEGEKADQIPVPVIRMLQRFMRMLSTPLQEGPGYNVDARLRPTGSYGPLAVTRSTWEDYYAKKADIWEIQALLRFRPIAGDARLGSELQRMGRSFCFQKRDPETVWPRLCSLRKRMEEERAAEREDAVDIKLGPGGLVDLEFLTQGVQLLHGHENPALREGSTKALLAEALPHVPGGDRALPEMLEAFSAFKNLEHRAHLMSHRPGSLLSYNQFRELTSLSLWPAGAESRRIQTWEDLLAVRRRVRRFFNGVCGRAFTESHA